MEHPRTTKNVGQPCVICGQPANAQATVKALQREHTQLQALVRAFFTSEDKWVGAYRELERLGYTLDATTPAAKGGDGE